MLVLAVLAALAVFNLDRIVEEAIVRFGSEITGTSVSLEKSSIKPWSGVGSLTGLAIGNPEAFGNENAFSLGEIAVDIDLSTLDDEVIVINSVAIIAPQVLYLHDGSTDNLGVLIANIRDRLGNGERSRIAEEESQIKIIIDEFIFSEGVISASHAFLGDRRIAIDLPELELRGIGREEGGATLQEAGEQIFAYLNSEIRGQITDSALYVDALAGVEELVTSELENVQEQAREQIENIRSQGENVEQQVRGLLDAFNR